MIHDDSFFTDEKECSDVLDAINIAEYQEWVEYDKQGVHSFELSREECVYTEGFSAGFRVAFEQAQPAKDNEKASFSIRHVETHLVYNYISGFSDGLRRVYDRTDSNPCYELYKES